MSKYGISIMTKLVGGIVLLVSILSVVFLFYSIKKDGNSDNLKKEILIKGNNQKPKQLGKKRVVLERSSHVITKNKQNYGKGGIYSNPVQPSTPQQITQPIKIEYYTPDSSIKFATGDILTVPEELQPFIRYVSLYNIPKDRRRDVAAIVSFVCNSLGRRRKIYIPEFVGASDETVIRININDYEWNPNAWEGLAENGSGPNPEPEPYFHYFIEEPIVETRKVKKIIQETKKVPNGTDQFGRPRFKNEIVDKEIEVDEPISTIRKKTLAVAPWIDNVGIQTLMELTGSDSPVIRADWFIINATLPPVYYNFLGVGKTLKDFENLVFANAELAKKARSQDKAVVVSSIVAKHNRTLTRSPTFTNGYYWRSHDTLRSVDDRDYVMNILNETFDATEDIGTLPNGLQAYFLANADGSRLDFANPDIAIDNNSIDRLVRAGRSCIVCHAEGIRPINDEIRTLTQMLSNKESVKLLIAREIDQYRIADLFSSDIDEQIIKDQNVYRSAVSKTNGLSSEKNAAIYAEIYDSYVEYLLTTEIICREIGMSETQLKQYAKHSNDHVILGLFKKPIRPVRRDQWERSFQKFMILVMNVKAGKPFDQPVGPLVPNPN